MVGVCGQERSVAVIQRVGEANGTPDQNLDIVLRLFTWEIMNYKY